MNQGWTYRDRISPSFGPCTVWDYYCQRYDHSSPNQWRDRIVQGQISLNGQPCQPETLLQPGDRLAYRRPPWQEPAVPLEFELLYIDADLGVAAKPSGLPVLPGAGFLQHTLLGQLQQRDPDAPYTPIHRLGRGTSGLVLLARSPLAKSSLTQQMRDRTIRKRYLALVQGCDLPDQLSLTQPIGRVPHPSLGYLWSAWDGGLSAHSELQVLQRRPTTALVQVEIFTGRPHQIRIHTAAAGYPLVGDPLYGPGAVAIIPAGLPPVGQTSPVAGSRSANPVPGDCGYHLHAHQLEFIHPRTQARMHLECPPPPILTSRVSPE
jgi:23S rRNA pseudouridine1911/1915/1917 synthase